MIKLSLIEIVLFINMSSDFSFTPPSDRDSRLWFFRNCDLYDYNNDTYGIFEYNYGNLFIKSKKLNKTVEIATAQSYIHGYINFNDSLVKEKSLLVYKNQNYDFYKIIIPNMVIFTGNYIIIPGAYSRIVRFESGQIPKDVRRGVLIYDLNLTLIKFIDQDVTAKFNFNPSYMAITGGHYIINDQVYDNNFNKVDTIGPIVMENPVIDGKIHYYNGANNQSCLYDPRTKSKTNYQGVIKDDYIMDHNGGSITFKRR